MTDEEYSDLLKEMRPLLKQGEKLFRPVAKLLNRYYRVVRADPNNYRREEDLKEILLALALYNKLALEKTDD